jgi:hypothetical protein
MFIHLSLLNIREYYGTVFPFCSPLHFELSAFCIFLWVSDSDEESAGKNGKVWDLLHY